MICKSNFMGNCQFWSFEIDNLIKTSKGSQACYFEINYYFELNLSKRQNKWTQSFQFYFFKFKLILFGVLKIGLLRGEQP